MQTAHADSEQRFIGALSEQYAGCFYNVKLCTGLGLLKHKSWLTEYLYTYQCTSQLQVPAALMFCLYFSAYGAKVGKQIALETSYNLSFVELLRCMAGRGSLRHARMRPNHVMAPSGGLHLGSSHTLEAGQKLSSSSLAALYGTVYTIYLCKCNTVQNTVELDFSSSEPWHDLVMLWTMWGTSNLLKRARFCIVANGHSQSLTGPDRSNSLDHWQMRFNYFWLPQDGS